MGWGGVAGKKSGVRIEENQQQRNNVTKKREGDVRGRWGTDAGVGSLHLLKGMPFLAELRDSTGPKKNCGTGRPIPMPKQLIL